MPIYLAADFQIFTIYSFPDMKISTGIFSSVFGCNLNTFWKELFFHIFLYFKKSVCRFCLPVTLTVTGDVSFNMVGGAALFIFTVNTKQHFSYVPCMLHDPPVSSSLISSSD